MGNRGQSVVDPQGRYSSKYVPTCLNTPKVREVADEARMGGNLRRRYCLESDGGETGTMDGDYTEKRSVDAGRTWCCRGKSLHILAE